MRARRHGWRRTRLLAALLLGAQAGLWGPPTGTAQDAGSAARCELGILHATAGDLARAESVFVGLLSTTPRDARALTNLGNLALLRDQPALALAYYDRAAMIDTADAGIRLDRALALALLELDSESQAEAREGIRMAGNMAAAGTLLGMRSAGSGEERAAPATQLTREEVRALLRASLQGMMADSTRPRPRSPDRPRFQARRRTAGPRADAQVDPGSTLYWKR